MNLSELRIGNLISWISTGNIERVMTIEPFYVNRVSESDLKPIPLTEEWLLRFGFKPDHNYFFFENEDHGVELEASWSQKNMKTGETYSWCISEYQHVKNLHQLQNLYFALTGEELKKIK